MKFKHRPNDKILVVTLGCSKNIVDSENLMFHLSQNGLKVDYDQDNSDARTVIINTCGFITAAKEESINTILSFVKAKEKGKIDSLYVMGCLSERYAKELQHEIPEVDQFFGVNNIAPIIETLGYDYKNHLIGERLLTTPSHYAYLKISEGCNRTCSFCAIPFIRGKHISKPLEQLVDETKKLAQNGVKELILIAQDLSSYGIDLYKKHMLAELVNRLAEINGIEWIRLHYAYPVDFSLDLIETIKNNLKVCKYLDIPLQHSSNRILLKMRRGHTKEHLQSLISSIRSAVPNIALRSTFLVGFPGETTDDFNDLCAFLKEIRFDRVGVFPYSHEENTFAGSNLIDNISAKTKKHRVETLMKIQQEISYELNQQKIGQTFKTIIDREEGQYYIGRTEYDSPEVDNEVLIDKSFDLSIGNFYYIKIYNADAFDLFGKLI